jgi:hypothetical protein
MKVTTVIAVERRARERGVQTDPNVRRIGVLYSREAKVTGQVTFRGGRFVAVAIALALMKSAVI